VRAYRIPELNNVVEGLVRLWILSSTRRASYERAPWEDTTANRNEDTDASQNEDADATRKAAGSLLYSFGVDTQLRPQNPEALHANERTLPFAMPHVLGKISLPLPKWHSCPSKADS
jgi:hypothetical protein